MAGTPQGVFKNVIRDNFDRLVNALESSDQLICKLRFINSIKNKLCGVAGMLPMSSRNAKIVNAMLQVSEDQEDQVMNEILRALRSCRQGHVANLFRQETEEIIMTDEHYDILSKNRADICKFLEPRDGLLDILIRHDVFTDIQRSLIVSKAGVDEMAQQTVECLKRRPDSAFDTFICALNETEQKHVSFILTGVGKIPLSVEHRKVLSINAGGLCKYIDAENKLLDALQSCEVLTNFDTLRVRSKMSYNAMARELIQIMMRKSDDAFCVFTKTLKDSGQGHVAYILTGEGDDPPLEEELRQKLTENRVYLVQTIDSMHSGLITALIGKGVFSDYDQQRVENRKPNTDIDRGEVVLDLMARKSQSSFDKFIVALRETGQEHVAIAFVGAEVVAKIIARTKPDAPLAEREIRRGLQFALDTGNSAFCMEVFAQHGISVSEFRNGSILVVFRCKCFDAVDTLKRFLRSGQLDAFLSEMLILSPRLHHSIESLTLGIQDSEFDRCKEMFDTMKLMTLDHRDALMSSSEWLVDKLTVSDVLLDSLQLCDRRRQAILRAASPVQQVKTLLDIVSRQPDSTFTQFLNALNQTQQDKAAQYITSSYSALIHTKSLLCIQREAERASRHNVKYVHRKAESGALLTQNALATRRSLHRMRSLYNRPLPARPAGAFRCRTTVDNSTGAQRKAFSLESKGLDSLAKKLTDEMQMATHCAITGPLGTDSGVEELSPTPGSSKSKNTQDWDMPAHSSSSSY